jgi:glutamate carboxypeptidase
MPSTLGPDILDYLRDCRDRMVALCRRLVEMESPSSDPAAVRAVLELLADELAERGFRVRSLSGVRSCGQLLAVPPRRVHGASTQLLIGHADTVWPIGTLATRPIRLESGTLSGPGVYDMKAGLVQGIFALEAIEACGARPEVTPLLFINSDEEVGSRESRRQIVRLARAADRALILEPSLGPRGRLKTARKGVGRFTVRVLGRAAHAGLEPEKGASAILELSLLIQKLFGLNDPQNGITVNVGTIDGGLRPNVVAPESRASVEVRVLTRAQAKAIEERIRGLEPTTPNTRIIVEGRFGRSPMERTPANARLWRLAREAGATLGLELEEATAGGASDGNITSLYTPTLDGLGPIGGGAHAEEEHVQVEPMAERAALLALLILQPALGRPGRHRAMSRRFTEHVT